MQPNKKQLYYCYQHSKVCIPLIIQQFVNAIFLKNVRFSPFRVTFNVEEHHVPVNKYIIVTINQPFEINYS